MLDNLMVGKETFGGRFCNAAACCCCCSRNSLRLRLLVSSWQSWDVGKSGGGRLQKKTLKKLKNQQKTHVSGSIFLNHWLLSASSAVILFSGSSVSILSNRSKAESGMYANSSRSLLRYCFFGCSELKCGNFMTFGHTAGVGDPQSLEMISSCSGSELPWKSVFFAKSSPRMQPTDHTSIDGPYLKAQGRFLVLNKIYTLKKGFFVTYFQNLN